MIPTLALNQPSVPIVLRSYIFSEPQISSADAVKLEVGFSYHEQTDSFQRQQLFLNDGWVDNSYLLAKLLMQIN